MDKIDKGKLIKAENIINYMISSAITEIENFAFMKNEKMQELYMPDTVKRVGISTFEGCTSLVKARISENIDIITMSMFKDCKKLLDINIHSFLKVIGNFAFSGCEELKIINIPSSVQKIGDFAFSGCKKLKEIHIQGTYTDISEDAFYDCDNVRNISVGDKKFDIYPDEKMRGLEIYNKNIFVKTTDENDREYIYTLSEDKSYFKKITERQRLMMKLGLSEIEYQAILADIKRACFDSRSASSNSLLIHTKDSVKEELMNKLLKEMYIENPELSSEETQKRVFVYDETSVKCPSHRYKIDLDKGLDDKDYYEIFERCEETKRTNDATETYERSILKELSSYRNTREDERKYEIYSAIYEEKRDKETEAVFSYNPFKRFKVSRYRKEKEKAYKELMHYEESLNKKARENAMKREKRPKQLEKTTEIVWKAKMMSKALEDFNQKVRPFVNIEIPLKRNIEGR